MFGNVTEPVNTFTVNISPSGFSVKAYHCIHIKAYLLWSDEIVN